MFYYNNCIMLYNIIFILKSNIYKYKYIYIYIHTFLWQLFCLSDEELEMEETSHVVLFQIKRDERLKGNEWLKWKKARVTEGRRESMSTLTRHLNDKRQH